MNQFSAKEPSLGYHYQIRYALFLLLSVRDKDEPFIRLENLDDVEIGDINKIDLHQTKFHTETAANLTDTSPDFWKTIRVWSELIIQNQIDLDNSIFLLVTTSETSENSILRELTEKKEGFKTIENIIAKLNDISNKSKNTDLQSAFKVYNQLTIKQKEGLIKNINICDNAIGFEDLKKGICKELQLSCLPEQVDNVFNDLQGWFYEQCITHLRGKKDKITFNETRSNILNLIEKYKSDNLPIDPIIREIEVNETDFENRIFVAQLQEIRIGKNTIRQAKSDFYRASEQRSKWLREDLLHPAEEIDYEFRLKEDWKRKFANLQDEIEGIEDEIATQYCKDFYIRFYVNTYSQILIRPKVTEPYIVTGSCHMLADNQDIVWHPKYQK